MFDWESPYPYILGEGLQLVRVTTDSVAAQLGLEVDEEEEFQKWPGVGSKQAPYTGTSEKFIDGFVEFGFGRDFSTLKGGAKGDKLDDDNDPPTLYDPDPEEVIISY